MPAALSLSRSSMSRLLVMMPSGARNSSRKEGAKVLVALEQLLQRGQLLQGCLEHRQGALNDLLAGRGSRGLHLRGVLQEAHLPAELDAQALEGLRDGLLHGAALGGGVSHLLQPGIELGDDVLRNGPQLDPQLFDGRLQLLRPSPRCAASPRRWPARARRSPRCRAMNPWMFRSVSPMRAASSARPVFFLSVSASISSILRRMFFSRAASASMARSSSVMRSLNMRILALPRVLLHVELVELLVGLHELGLHGVHQVHLPGDGVVHPGDGAGDLLAAPGLLVQPGFPLLLVLQQPLQPQELDLQLDLEDLLAQRAVGFRLLRLRLEGGVAPPHLVEDPLDVAHVLFRLLQLAARLLARARGSG